ncbi:hypothetical protein IWQ56_005027 [Coemansia nantahalensis]|nr:hypothetical protein IWQ56_005027 [Coemansia nantahalensis]
MGMFEESLTMLRRAVDLAKSEEEMVSAITFRETTAAQHRFMKEHPELLNKLMGGGIPDDLSQPGSPNTSVTLRPQKRRPRQNTHAGLPSDAAATPEHQQQLEIDNETLQLSIETMRIQLQEQKANYTEIIDGLVAELQAHKDAALREAADRRRRTEDLEAELARIKGLYRENLRDLVVARKTAPESKHSVRQDNMLLRSEILALQRRPDAEMERARFLQTTAAPAAVDHDR